MSWKEIVKNAKSIKTYVEKNKKYGGIEGYNQGKMLALFATAIKNPGKDVVLTKSYKRCQNCTENGVYLNLTKKQYLDVANRALNWLNDKNHNGYAPNYISIGSSGKIGMRLAIFAFSKIIVFYDKNNQLPATCWFANNVFGGKVSTIGPVCKKLTEVTGINVKDYKSLYSAMGEFYYEFYYEDHQTQSRTISRMTGNCVDLNQVEYAALLELYDESMVQIVRGDVSCSDGVYGHVWCRIKLNGAWTNIDASAAAKGKPLGSVICQSVVDVTDINPSWAVYDTGDS